MSHYYRQWANAYRACTPEQREQSKTHWVKCHRENLKSGREDLIMFSAAILAEIAIIEQEDKEA